MQRLHMHVNFLIVFENFNEASGMFVYLLLAEITHTTSLSPFKVVPYSCTRLEFFSEKWKDKNNTIVENIDAWNIMKWIIRIYTIL